MFDQLPRHDDDKGDWDKDHVRDHTAALAHQHVKRAAHAAFAVFQERPFDHLIIAAPEDLTHEVEHELHSYVRDRIAARVTGLPINASESTIRATAVDVEKDVERRKEAASVARLREASGTGKAVVGLDGVLAALADRRVDTLVVSDGFEAPGFRCGDCGFLAPKGRTCPRCSSTMDRCDDVVEDAIQETLAQSGKLAVCVGNADLDVLGRIGALLRY
jgi:peptide chain release factor subunit 1